MSAGLSFKRPVVQLSKRLWLSDVSTYPIIAILSGATVFMTYTCFNFLARNPDVQWDREKRGTFVRMDSHEGAAWVASHEAMRHTSEEEYRITHSGKHGRPE